MWPWVVASAAAHAALLAGVIYIYSDAGMVVTDPVSGVEVVLISAANEQKIEAKSSVAKANSHVAAEHAPRASAHPVNVLPASVTRVATAKPVRSSAPLKKPTAIVEHVGKTLPEKEILRGDGQSQREMAVLSSSAQHRHADIAQFEGQTERNKVTVRKRLEQYKYYPMSARRRGIEGAVDVSFRLNADGRAEQMQLVSGSGYSILDDAALRTVRRAEPFPVHKGFYRFRLLFTRS